jgi:hypothetical protein
VRSNCGGSRLGQRQWSGTAGRNSASGPHGGVGLAPSPGCTTKCAGPYISFHLFWIFSNNQIFTKLCNSNSTSSLARKLFNWCKELYFHKMVNFLHWSNFKFQWHLMVYIFRTKFNLNLPRILKGFGPCGENLVNSLNIYLDLIFTKVNLVGHTCMQDYTVSTQVSKRLGLKLKKGV